jgi:hypothetical protein
LVKERQVLQKKLITNTQVSLKHTEAKEDNMKVNKLGVKNSLVNNINAKKKAGTSKPKSKSTVSAKDFKKLKTGKW